MVSHSSILAWKIPLAEKSGGYSPWGHKELDTTERLRIHTHTHTHTHRTDIRKYLRYEYCKKNVETPSLKILRNHKGSHCLLLMA